MVILSKNSYIFSNISEVYIEIYIAQQHFKCLDTFGLNLSPHLVYLCPMLTAPNSGVLWDLFFFQWFSLVTVIPYTVGLQSCGRTSVVQVIMHYRHAHLWYL